MMSSHILFSLFWISGSIYSIKIQKVELACHQYTFSLHLEIVDLNCKADVHGEEQSRTLMIFHPWYYCSFFWWFLMKLAIQYTYFYCECLGRKKNSCNDCISQFHLFYILVQYCRFSEVIYIFWFSLQHCVHYLQY